MSPFRSGMDLLDHFNGRELREAIIRRHLPPKSAPPNAPQATSGRMPANTLTPSYRALTVKGEFDATL